jgi:hypothetical protein
LQLFELFVERTFGDIDVFLELRGEERAWRVTPDHRIR